MTRRERPELIVGEMDHKEPDVGRWLWALQDNREKTLSVIATIDDSVVDWLPGPEESSVGSVLRHIAEVEAEWFYGSVRQERIPAEVSALFPDSERDPRRADGQMYLTQVRGHSIQEHQARLAAVRSKLLATFSNMSLGDFRRQRSTNRWDVTPEWIIYHLIEHEAEHRGQLIGLCDRTPET